jgi:hypothetical protein
MSEPLKRRSLLGALDTPPPVLPEAVIAATAASNGFAAIEGASGPESESVVAGARRRRQPTGRIHQFNVRLRADTLEAIYIQANGRNVPVAQVIEEAMAALARP